MTDQEERLDRLESLVEEQQRTIEAQRRRIDELAASRSDGDAALPATTRRSTLKTGGLLALLGLGAGTASADPQGQVGTGDDPIETLHAAAIEGPLTDGVRLDSLVGEGLAVRGGKLTNAIDVPALSITDVSIPSVDETETFAVDVTVDETAGVQTEGLSVTIEIPTGGGQTDERTVDASDIQGQQATVTVGDGSPFGRLDSGEYTATATVDATNAEPATASEQFTVEGRFAGGDGSSENPYQIATWHHLDHVRTELEGAFVQVADLTPTTDGYDALASASANDGEGFDPIGDEAERFEGTFRGDDHVIEGLNANPEDQYVGGGLFGETGPEALIEGVALVDVAVDGGALVVTNNGTVTHSYATGSVESGRIEIGALVGGNSGIVRESYASVNVRGTGDLGRIGGLVGVNSGSVEQSFATGSVSGGYDHGGLVGANSETVTDGYWDSDSTGQSSSAGSPDSNGLTTSEMQGDEAESNMSGFDFTDVWETVDAGNDAEVSEDDYPVLQALDRQAQLESRE